jgi:hypothetical protein
LALWKIIYEEDAILIHPKKSRQELYHQIFALGIFWGGVSHYASTPLIVALSLGHSDITRFHPWTTIAIANHWVTPKEKFPKVAQMTGTVDIFFINVQVFWDPHCRELLHVQIFMKDGPNPLM